MDSGRIEVNPELPPLTIAPRLLNEMQAHAVETAPEECCGLLTGAAPGRFQTAHRCQNDMTKLHLQNPAEYPRDGRRAFHMNEGDYLRVLTAAEAQGAMVTGVYHSHADAGAYFSAMDQSFAAGPAFPFPDAWHVVIPVFEGLAKSAAAFRRTNAAEGAPAFEGRRLIAEAAGQ